MAKGEVNTQLESLLRQYDGWSDTFKEVVRHESARLGVQEWFRTPTYDKGVVDGRIVMYLNSKDFSYPPRVREHHELAVYSFLGGRLPTDEEAAEGGTNLRFRVVAW